MDLVFLVINDLLNREYIHWMQISKQSMSTDHSEKDCYV